MSSTVDLIILLTISKFVGTDTGVYTVMWIYDNHYGRVTVFYMTLGSQGGWCSYMGYTVYPKIYARVAIFIMNNLEWN